MSGIRIGDGDADIDGARIRPSAGGFSATDDLVIMQSAAASLSTADAAATIGSATSACAVGATALFVVHAGSSSGVYLFSSGNADVAVTSSTRNGAARGFRAVQAPLNPRLTLP